MTSNDQQQSLTIELFNAKMDALMAQIQLGDEKLRNELLNVRSELHNELQSVHSELRNEIQVLHSDVKVNSAQIAELHHFMYWGIAILALIATVVPFLRRERKEKEQTTKQEQHQPGLTEQKVQDMIAQALDGFKPAGK